MGTIHNTVQRDLWRLLFAVGFLFQSTAVVAEGFAEDDAPIKEIVLSDYKSFYSGKRLTRLGIGFGVGAVLANTKIDKRTRDEYQRSLRGSGSDDVADMARIFGEVAVVVPISLLSASVNLFDHDSPIATGGRTLQEPISWDSPRWP